MKAKFNKFLILLTALIFGFGQMWATSGTITAAASTDLGSGNTPRYVVEQAGVGRLMKNATGSSSWSLSGSALTTGSSKFALQTYNAISSIIIYGNGTGNNRTFSSMRVGSTTSNYASASATGTGTMASGGATDQTITITPASNIAADSYVEITLSGNINIYSVELVYVSATKHSVEYVLNGGGGTTPTQADVAEGAKFTLHDGVTGITAPTSKEFAGWNDGSTTYAGGAEYTMGTSNVTLTAQWQDITTKYTVTYNVNGGESAAPTETDKAEGAVFTLAAAPTWIGHVFDGWLCSADAAVKAAGASYTMTAANTTFTAQWHELDCKLYSLTGGIGSATIEADAGNAEVNAASLVLKGSNAIIKLTPGEGTFKAGDVLTISGTVGNTSKNFGIKISNAADKKSTLGLASVAGTTNPMIATATLSADADYLYICRDGGTTQTLLTCEIHRSCAAGADAGLAYATASVDKITTDAAFTNALTNANGLVIASYKSSDASVATVNAQNGQVTIVGVGDATITAYSAIQTKAGTLYAAGTASYTLHVATPPTYTVTYAANGGDGTMTDANEYAAGDEVTLLANTFTAPSGYAWSAWAVTDALANPVAISEGKFIMPASNATVTAQWALLSDFDVKFYPGYGANEQIGATQTIATGNHATAPATDPTREGYRFLGWSTDGTEANIKDVASYVITAATDFTAVWVLQFEVTFNLQGHGATIAAQNVDNGGKVSKPADPSEVGQEFGGWYKEAACTNAWDFATDVVTSATELFAKWTAFTGCAMLVPATSGSALADGDEVDLQASSTGGSIYALAKSENLTYTANGLQFGSTSGVKARVVLNNDLAVGTTISLKLVAAGTKTRGLFLYTSAGAKINDFTCWVEGVNDATNGAEATFTYTVTAGDGLEGTNEFQLWRNNTVILNTLKVESCGSAVIFHDLTSAVDPAGMGTVTLGASSVREGLTTTAEYSAIDPAYEFDEWQISGTDATIDDAHANPVTITMGTADAVITLKLKTATVKHTVTFDAQGGSAVDAQEVEDGGNAVVPTAPTRDEYIFQGWSETTDGAVVDVTAFTISAPKTFYAIWEAEPAGIKLLDGSTVNHTNFITGVTADETVEFKGNIVNYAKFSGTVSGVSGVKDLTRVIAYNATTNQTKIRISAHNNSTSARNILVKGLVEGADAAVDLATIALGNKEDKVSDWIEFNNAANRTIYIMVPSSAGDVYFTQVKVVEDGATSMKQAGEAGYSLNLNQGRPFGVKLTDIAFEGFHMEVTSDYQPINSTAAKLKSTSAYVTVATPVTMTVTAANAATYYVTKDAAGTDNETALAGASIFDLTAGTWYITAGGSEVQLTSIAFTAPRVDRTITFDSDGGSAVADIVVKDGDVATAPTDPTKDDNDFAGWYNGSDPYDWSAAVTSDLTLTAHWTAHVTNDATLKSLKYGETDIALSDGVYEYNVNLPALTLAVPALTAETNAALANAVVTDAADFDGSGQATSTVLVTAEDHSTQLTYTVNFTKAALLPQVDVTATTTWDWTNIASENITLTGGLKNYECVLANVEGVTNDATFNSQALLFCGERVRNVESARTFATIGHLSFNVTVAGTVRVEFSDNGDNNRRVKINDEQSDASSSKTDVKTFEANVTAGTVTIMGISNDGASTNQYVRISRIEFVAAAAADYTRSGLSAGKIGTLYVGHATSSYTGATFYEIESKSADGKTINFAEVTGQLENDKPYIFEATADEIQLFYADKSYAAPATANHNGLYGVTAETHVGPSADIYYISNNKLYKADTFSGAATDLTVDPNRCYIDITEVPVGSPSPAPGKRYITLKVDGENAATGVDQLNASETPVKMIINGQLFILRGEKLYNANGQLVK